jgi:hypothetical protein
VESEQRNGVTTQNTSTWKSLTIDLLENEEQDDHNREAKTGHLLV